MDDHSTAWDATRVGAAIAALLGAVKFFFRARNTNTHDRIRKLERQMEDFKRAIEDIPAALESIGGRVRHQEVGLIDLRREMRDSLSEIEEIAQRVRRKLEAD